MAKSIIADGEGATKLIEISVNSAKSDADADRAAKFIANSPLVKTALNGSDANWGRIISALGSSDIHFNPEKVEIKFGELSVLKPPFIVSFCEDEARKILSEKEVKISIELNEGSASSTWYTCDFSEKYIQINSSYRS
jgi:glutamate N-acetyltransferase/amino-acid N-acetyltransferase